MKYFITNNPQVVKPFYRFLSSQNPNKFRLKKLFTSYLTTFTKNQIRTRVNPHTINHKVSNFLHRSFFLSKKYFNSDRIFLIGQTPSYYLNDLKPMKYWKLLSAIQATTQPSDPKTFFLKNTKVKPYPRTLIRRKLRLYLLTVINQQQINVKSQQTAKLNTLHKFKPFIRRVPTPHYVLKWKTSYPLMFTAAATSNRPFRNKLDLTINHFMRSRLNRRVRRTARNFFKKVKRNLNKKKKTRNSMIKTVGRRLSVTRAISKKNQLTFTNLLLRHKTPNAWVKNCVLTRSIKSHTYKHRLPLHTKFTKMINNQNPYTIKSLRKQYSPVHLLNSPLVAHRTKPKLKQVNTLFLSKVQTNQPPYITKTVNNFKWTTPQLQSIAYKENAMPIVTTRTRKSFIFKNTGMFLNALTYSNQKNPFTYKFLFKKKLFSFLYPNEVRNSLMNRKKRITFYKLVYKYKHKVKNKPRYSIASFNKLLLHQYKASLSNKTDNLITNSLFDKKAPTIGHSNLNYRNYLTSRDEILYPSNFTYRGQDTSFRWSEVKIPRIRFKPGYQRMWRRARTALKESLNLKFVYQKQLTRYLTRFYKGSNKYTFSRAEMSLNRVVMYSRLLPDNPTVDAFLSKKLIYLNGRTVCSANTILVPNDIVQIIVSMWYYVTYRWIANWTLKRGKKFKKLVYRKGLAGKQKVIKLKKQRSYYTPNWIYLTRYDISDVKPYLEVDYFTLSTIVLYEPFTTFYFSPDETPDFRPTIYRMYNWKYIT